MRRSQLNPNGSPRLGGDDDRLRWWDRWNLALFPWIGPPPLGPYDEEPLPPTGPKPCPVCGAAMELHTITRTADDHTPTRLHCPVP